MRTLLQNVKNITMKNVIMICNIAVWNGCDDKEYKIALDTVNTPICEQMNRFEWISH